MSFLYRHQNHEFIQLHIVSDQSLQINPHTNNLQRVSTLFQQSHNTQAAEILSIPTTKSDTTFRFPNFSSPPAVKIGIGTVLVLLTLGGFLFSKKKVQKQSVPNSDVLKHHQQFEQITFLAQQVQQADDEKFTRREFTTYLQLKIGLISSQEDGLYKSIQFLKTAISSKRHFDQIFVVEARYMARQQQQLYQFADDLVSQGIFGEEFRQQIEAKLTIALSGTPTDEGKSALNVYTNSLIELSHSEYGLELLGQFKRYEMFSYALIRTIHELAAKFESMDLTDSNVLLPDIMLKLDAIEQMAAIVDIPKIFANHEGFVKIFHFMALEDKHQETTGQFKRLISMIERWKPVYRELQSIRGFGSTEPAMLISL